MAGTDGKTRKRRVAIVVPDLSVHSGVPALVLFLYRILAASEQYEPAIISISSSVRDANSVRLLSPSSWFGKATSTSGDWQGIPFVHVGAEFTEFEFQRYKPRRVLTELLDQYDVVQVVGGCPPWGLVAKNFKGRVALMFASLTSLERATKLKKLRGPRRAWLSLMSRINVSLEGPAMRRADVMFVINKMMRERLTEEFGDDKVIFAPPGIDTEYYQPSVYQEDGYLLCVGRLEDPRKNVRMLFDAYSRLRQAMENAPRLVLAGETVPTQDDLAYAEAAGIMPHLEIHQSVSLEKLRALYQNASLFLLTSNEEGLGLVIAEAMACGIPVIATSCGGPETLVVEGETGELTAVGDASAMCVKIHSLLNDPELRQRMSVAARRRAVDHFSIEATGKVFLDHYDLLLSDDRVGAH
jgi:glycosyltransferase involved in cell wall biosynthesis